MVQCLIRIFYANLQIGQPLESKNSRTPWEVGVKIKNLILSLVVCVTALSLLEVMALADTIKLRDGSVLKGKVVSYNQRRFVIVVKIGNTTSQHDIPIEEVESVEFDSADTAGLTVAGRTNTAYPPSTQPETAPTIPNPPVAETQPVAQTSLPAPSTSEADTGVIAVIAEKTVSVAAGADWTSSDIRVQRGQRIVISAIGEVDIGNGKRTGPEGMDIADKDKLMPSHKTGALIAVIGDDNNDFVFVGQSTEFVSKHNGILFLSINEGNLRDNNGAFVARIKVLSNR